MLKEQFCGPSVSDILDIGTKRTWGNKKDEPEVLNQLSALLIGLTKVII